MAKGYTQLTKSDPPNLDEQKIVSRKETQKLVHENKKTSINGNFRQNSQKFLRKLRRMTFHSISSNQEEQKTNDICEENGKNSSDISNINPTSLITPQYLPKSNDKPKLKGILKNSINDSCNNHNDILSSESHFEICHTSDSKENRDKLIPSNGDFNDLYSTSNSSKSIKHVTFNDNISKNRYKPGELCFNITKLSHRQAKELKKLHRKDSLNLTESKFQEFAFSQSSEDESSDDDDND